MSTAAAAEVPVPARGKKKLILIVAAAALVLAVGGGAAAFMVKRNADAELVAAEDEEGTPVQAAAADEARATPIFVPLDPFTVNLADRNADRYAQVGITLEVDSAKTGDQIKAYMPAIRNNILMAIADRTASDLLAREGKSQLAERVRRETAQALGHVVQVVDAPPDDEASRAAAAKNRRSPAAQALPVKAVHFSNFIIQ
ncbi:MAG: flagellar basal body-associated FliL family protein [Rubrivivax sp.]|nr:flagellar basal body-associated FliL family protein [Rubrivivax sp.]